jgi:hypothetical protein
MLCIEGAETEGGRFKRGRRRCSLLLREAPVGLVTCEYGAKQVEYCCCSPHTSLASCALTLFFPGDLSDLPVNFDRILTDSGAIPRNSGRYRRGGSAHRQPVERSVVEWGLSEGLKGG